MYKNNLQIILTKIKEYQYLQKNNKDNFYYKDKNIKT